MIGLPVEELIECLRGMTTIEDPVGMSPEERRALANPEPYMNATKEEMGVAYNCLKKEAKTHLQSDLIDFVCDIWAYTKAYRKSGELWSKFGDTRETQLVEIRIVRRKEGDLMLSRFTISSLKRYCQGREPMRSWAKEQLSIIEGSRSPPGSMVIYYVDVTKEKFHGYPFDFHFYEERPREGIGRRVA